MSKQINISTGNKNEKYQTLLPQIAALIDNEPDVIANLANVSAALHETFRFWWVGFYIVKGDELVLGPFQGPVACSRIARGKGVCGTAWQQKHTIIVPDVHKFPGHIACSAASRSEIVVPILKQDEVVAVLDVDSDMYNAFDHTDQLWLEKLAAELAPRF